VANISGKEKLHEIVPEVPPDTKAPVDTVFDIQLTKILQVTFTDRYEEIQPLIDSLITANREAPAPYFFKAASLQGWMSSYRINKFEKEVEESVDHVIEKGKLLLEKGDDPWVHFYLGGAYGYRGFARFRKHNWIGAYKDAKRGIGHFEKALEVDSTLYDVYLGLGSYYYWRTAKSKFIRIIAFWMSDQRELGLDQLRFTIKHGRYAVNESIYVLLASYFDAEQYENAMEILNMAKERKEIANLTDLYFQGRLMNQFGRWAEVDSVFNEIYHRIKDYKYPSIGFQVECKYWMAKAKNETGKYEEAFQLTSDALSQSRERDKDLEIEGHIDSFDDIKKQLEKLHKELSKRGLKSTL
jgi:tetratricopeptide (TPR) repeat protein